MSFRKNLKESMKVCNVTTKELSVKTGINENTISSYLKNDGAQPTAEKAVKIAEALNTSVEFLVTGFEKSKMDATFEVNHVRKYDEIINSFEKLPPEAQKPIERLVSDISKKFSK